MSEVIHWMQLEDDDSAWVDEAGNCGGPPVCKTCMARLVRFTNIVKHECDKLGLRLPQTKKEWDKVMKRRCNRKPRNAAATGPQKETA